MTTKQLDDCIHSLTAKLILSSLLVFGAVAPESRAQTSPIPDFYQEAGVDKDRALVSDNANEAIDPFTGGLTLVHTDMVVPGNGGLDIEIRRFYTNLQGKLAEPTPFGMGWTMHFGRVITGAAGGIPTPICSPGNYNTLDNATLELPDGSRQILLDGKYEFSPGAPNPYQVDFITAQFWKGECIPNGGSDGFNAIAIYSPAGMRYDMTHVSLNDSTPVYYVSKITDRNGNFIDISYREIGGSVKYTVIDKIDASDGRKLQFTYADAATESARLQFVEKQSSFSLPGGTPPCAYSNPNYRFEYVHQAAATSLGVPYYQLTQVIRPDGTSWSYDYYPESHAVWYERYSLKTLGYPYGGATTYTYQTVNFDVGNTITSWDTVVVSTKTTSNPLGGPLSGGPASGTWSWYFYPGFAGTFKLDATVVISPIGRTEYFHYGLVSAITAVSVSGGPRVWAVGTLAQKSSYDDAANLLEVESYYYDSTIKISTELSVRPTRFYNTNLVDDASYVPLVTETGIWREGTTYTTLNEAFDAYKNVTQVREVGNTLGAGDSANQRLTTRTYWNSPSQWILGQPETETISGTLLSSRNYFSNGNLQSVTERGVTTNYTYTSEGDVATVTDGNGKITTTSSYYRGVARSEAQPEGVNLTRWVNGWGTTAGSRNGRGHTTCFSYDDMNRITAASPPIHNAIAIARPSAVNKAISRGGYRDTFDFDGYGQTAQTEQRDTGVGGEVIARTTRYDAMGRKIFESLPNSTSGTAYEYDAIGRTTKVTHPDSKFVTTEYLSGNQTLVTDERGFKTLYSYRSFGDPNTQELWKIEAEYKPGVTVIPLTSADAAPNLKRSSFDRSGNTVITDIVSDSYRSFGGANSQELWKIEAEYKPGLTVIPLTSADAVPNLKHWSIDLPSNAVITDIVRDGLGQVTSVSIGGVTRTYSYDPVTTQLMSKTDPEVGTTRYAYDAAGNMICKAIAAIASSCGSDSNRIIYTYDDRNRVKLINYPGTTPDVSFTYDKNDNLLSVSNANAVVEYSYDENNNQTGQTTTIDGKAYAFVWNYNNNDHLDTQSYPSGLTVDYAPDPFGRPQKALPFITDVTYHPNGQPQTTVYANGYTATTTQTPRLWLKSLKSSGPNGLPSFDYLYDDSGNLTSITDTNDSRYNVGLAYDGINRLTAANGHWGNMGLSYQGAGNIDVKTLGATTFDYAYNAQNRLQNISNLYPNTIQYDRLGNTTLLGDKGMSYDEASNLVQQWTDNAGLPSPGSTTTHRYDGNSRRVASQKEGNSAVLFAYSQAEQLLMEDNLQTRQYSEYVYLGNQLIAVKLGVSTVNPPAADLNADGSVDSRDLGVLMSAWGTTGPPGDLDSSGTVDQADMQLLLAEIEASQGIPSPEIGNRYYHSDALGSPIAATDQGGNVLWKEVYAPFGERILKQAANTQGRGHTGHFEDAATGFVYAGKRFYDPVGGRFLGIDPQDVNPGDLHTFNRYAYAANNPYTYVDPDGNSVWTKAAKLLIKGGDVADAFADTFKDVSVLVNTSASVGSRALAGVSILTELLPVSINDAKWAKQGYDAWKGAKNVEVANKPDFIVSPKGATMPTNKDFNLVDSNKKGGDWFQIHNKHTDAKVDGSPHTHYPKQHDGSRTREIKRTDGADLDRADNALRNGTMRERKNRGDKGG